MICLIPFTKNFILLSLRLQDFFQFFITESPKKNQIYTISHVVCRVALYLQMWFHVSFSAQRSLQNGSIEHLSLRILLPGVPFF